jgi:hypothetical protein
MVFVREGENIRETDPRPVFLRYIDELLEGGA